MAATYFTDFSDAAASTTAPPGWTEIWAQPAGAGSWKVVAGAGFGGTKVALQLTNAAALTNAIKWDAVDGDAARDNAEIVFRWKNSVQGPTGANDGRAILRGSGTVAGTENGYVVGNVNISNRVAKFVGGVRTDVQNVTQAPAADTWYWTRARVNGSTVQNKMWADGTTEPTTWAQTLTDTSITGDGFVGFFQSVINGVTSFDCVGVATGGGTAPMTAPAVAVSAGPDVTAPAGQAVTITGTATSTGGTIASRAWTVVSAVGGATPTLTGATTATVTLTPASAGKYTLRFTATDSLGGSGTDEVTVYATTAAEARPIATVSSNGWTVVGAATAHAALADDLDTTWVEAANPAGAAILVDLPPAPVGAKTVNYRVQIDPTTPGSGTWLVEYLSAGAVRASKNVTASTSGIVAGTLVLTDTQNAQVTDPNNQQLRFTATAAA